MVPRARATVLLLEGTKARDIEENGSTLRSIVGRAGGLVADRRQEEVGEFIHQKGERRPVAVRVADEV